MSTRKKEKNLKRIFVSKKGSMKDSSFMFISVVVCDRKPLNLVRTRVTEWGRHDVTSHSLQDMAVTHHIGDMLRQYIYRSLV